MRVVSGRLLNPYVMTAEDIDVHDIGHALARNCRYNGHVAGYLSVARHSLWVAKLLWDNHADLFLSYQGLHHDDAEAYIGDMIRPLKYSPSAESYRDLEAIVERVVFPAIGCPVELDQRVKDADTAIGQWELDEARDRWASTPWEDEQAWLTAHQWLRSRLDS